MYHKVVFIIPLIGYTEIAEGDVTYNSVKEAIGDLRLFIRLCRNRTFLIQLLRDSGRDRVDLNAKHTAVAHGVG